MKTGYVRDRGITRENSAQVWRAEATPEVKYKMHLDACHNGKHDDKCPACKDLSK